MKNIFSNTITLIRRILYICFYLLDTLSNQKTKLFILCYHGVADDTWRYSVNPETFKKQILYLIKKGYTPISLDAIIPLLKGEEKLKNNSFVVNIDDGYKDIYQLKNFFKETQITPAIFLLSDTKNANRKELTTEREFLNKNEILDLKNEGWIIGSHGATHSDFWALTDEEITKEVIDSKHILEKELNINIKYFAYPRGRYNDKILDAIKKAGYTLGLSMNDGFIDSKTNPLLIPRVGVDRTHTFSEFKSIFLPSSIRFRKFIKENIGVII